MANLKIYYHHHLRPYLYLIFSAALSYLPVSTMAFALKNDAIAFDLPIKFYLSECMHNGIQPFWFNSWAMGFPLEGILTCSIFSPFQLFFSTFFHYNLYFLHLEFLFYISLSGCAMFYFLRKHWVKDYQMAWIISLCYMLSGFTVGSSQWLWYISAAALLPLIICFLLDLFNKPSWRTALIFSIAYYFLLTSVYIPFSILITYILLGMFSYKIVRTKPVEATFSRTLFFFLALSGLVTFLLIATPIYSTLQVFSQLPRSKDLSVDPIFFNSNYLPPQGLLSLIVPASSTRMQFINTEGTMFNSYMGIFPILVLPLCIRRAKNFDKESLLVLVLGLFFLLLAMGPITPVRNWLNFLPGFSYFRNAGIMRLFFIFFILVFIARNFSKISLKDLVTQSQYKRYFLWAFFVMLSLYTLILLLHFNGIADFFTSSFVNAKTLIRFISLKEIVVLNSLLQFIIIIGLLIAWTKSRFIILKSLLVFDLIINTLICTPFFTVSSYSVNQLNKIFPTQSGFPIQTAKLSEVAPGFSIKEAIWNNTNIYAKQITANNSYWGPLTLKNFTPLNNLNKQFYAHPPIFSEDISQEHIEITEQKPDKVELNITKFSFGTIHILQNYYPGWRAYFNKVPVAIMPSNQGGMEIKLKGQGKLEINYKKNVLFTLILLTNLFIAFFTLFFTARKINAGFKSSSLSWPMQ